MIDEMIWEVYTVRNKKPPFEITEAALSDVRGFTWDAPKNDAR